jgi:DNA-binding response OmpR family regulator
MKTVLVVDDEPRIVQLARDYLEHAGFAVLAASDGRAALQIARSRRPDLVVLDLGLPGLDGLDVTRALRADGNLPIVMLTARDDEPADRIVAGELILDVPRLQGSVAGRSIELTPSEFAILATMARQPGRVFTRSQLLDAVRGDAFESYERAIDAHVKNIRRKIEPDPRQPRYILTVYGVGYRVAEPMP